jgi:polyisoprenoid-binding protein YceI
MVMARFRYPVASGGLLLLGSAVMAAPAGGPLAAKGNVVTASFTQMNVVVENPFTQVSGVVAFNAAAPATSTARIEIATASYDLGDAEYNAEVQKPEWFSAAAHPKAVFTANGLKPLGGDRYRAAGSLVLKGRQMPLTVPVTIKKGATGLSYSGQFTLSRKAFGIGGASWDEMVADAVTVKFTLLQAL